jgi:hypothetical protein
MDPSRTSFLKPFPPDCSVRLLTLENLFKAIPALPPRLQKYDIVETQRADGHSDYMGRYLVVRTLTQPLESCP